MSDYAQPTEVAPPQRANDPLAAPAARPVVLLFTVLLLALVAACAYELLVRLGGITGTEYAPGFAQWIDRIQMTQWLPWAAGGVAILGVALLILALKPRKHTHISAGDGQLWLRTTDVARLCSAAAMAQPGVARAQTSVSRKRATVVAVAGGRDPEELHADISAAVDAVLSSLDRQPVAQIRLTREENS